jgi:hypothetical protein
VKYNRDGAVEVMRMGEMDVVEKILESYNDVFADIVNVLLFNGESVIKPDELVDQAPRAASRRTEEFGRSKGTLPSAG